MSERIENPDHSDSEHDCSHYDGVYVDVDTEDDQFHDEVEIMKSTNNEDEEIPPEVVEKLKQHLIMQEYIAGVVDRAVEKQLSKAVKPV